MYRYACWDKRSKSIKLFTWDEFGNRIILDKPFSPYVYIEDARGKYKSIFGTPLIKKEFCSPFERERFIQDSGITRLFEKIKPAQQFLMDEFQHVKDDPDFTKFPLKICFFDIETAPTSRDEFPLVQETTGTENTQPTYSTLAPISLLTVHNNLTNKYTTFGINEFTGNLPEDLDCEYVYCETEYELLNSFIEYLEEDHPDILSGWNTNFFDSVYLVERIRKILGEEHLKRLSPIGTFWTKVGETKDNPPRYYAKYVTDGMLIVDYIDVYKKFKVKLQDSYRLDHIGEVEVGFKKLEYEGTIGEFQRRDWNKFVLYNIRDVELLVKIDKKLNYFYLFRLLATLGLTNFEDSLGVVAYNVGALSLLARTKGRIFYTPKREEEKGKNKGAYVSVRPGLTCDLFTLDFSSLYPNIIRSLNISPETMVGEFEYTDDGETVFLTLVSKKQYKLSREKFDAFVKAKKLIKSSANVLFTSTHGIVPEHMAIIFNRRKQARKELFEKEKILGEVIQKYNKTAENTKEWFRLQSERDKLSAEIIRLDVLQYALKLSINSLYGTLTSKTSPIGDDRLGNSTTLSGQSAIKEVNRFIEEYISNNYLDGEVIEPSPIQFNDTDSCGVTLKCLHKKGITICKDSKVTPEGFKIINDIADAVNKHIISWTKEHFNTSESYLDLKLEKICDFGLYRKKKNYILHVIYNEGKVDETTGEYAIKWAYVGVELAKAIMTKELKKIGQKVIEPMVLKQDKYETDKLLREAFQEYKKLPLKIISKLVRVKTFNKYVKASTMFKTAKGMQQHVRAAYYHNLVLQCENITGYQEIMEGDDCQLLMVKPNNKYRIDCIAFRNGELPPQFLEIFEVDYKANFKQPFYDCIESLYEIAGWKCPQVADEDNYECSIFDIFG